MPGVFLAFSFSSTGEVLAYGLTFTAVPSRTSWLFFAFFCAEASVPAQTTAATIAAIRNVLFIFSVFNVLFMNISTNITKRSGFLWPLLER